MPNIRGIETLIFQELALTSFAPPIFAGPSILLNLGRDWVNFDVDCL